MEGFVFAPYLGKDDRTIIDGCFGKNGHYPPRPEDEEWDAILLNKIIEASLEIEKARRKK